MTKQFYETLRELASAPSELGIEERVRDLLVEYMRETSDYVAMDDFGNLYAVREGGKTGRIALCAHQDKVMESTISGGIMEFQKILNTNIIFTSKKCANRAYLGASFVKTPKGFQEVQLYFPENAGLVSMGKDPKKPWNKEEFSYVRGARAQIIGDEVELPTEMFSLLGLRETEKNVRGKLDDTVGLTLIVDVFRNLPRSESPTLIALLTTGEEVGMKGAEYCVKNKINEYNPDKIIVLDTTRKQPLGSGIALYENCDRKSRWSYPVSESKVFSFEDTFPATSSDIITPAQYTCLKESVFIPGLGTIEISGAGRRKRRKRKWQKPEKIVSKAFDFERDLEKFAGRYGFPLKTHECGTNDSVVFASETKIPTVALEVPIENMHSAVEKCAKVDIETMRAFLRSYLTR